MPYKKPKIRKANATGRSDGAGESFVKLPRFMLHSPAWQDLTPQESRVFIQLLERYNGSNNGRIPFSVREARDLANISINTASKALHRLQALGFIELVTMGGFNIKANHNSEWRVNLYACDVSKQPANKHFMRWRPEKNTVSNGVTPRSQNRELTSLIQGILAQNQV